MPGRLPAPWRTLFPCLGSNSCLPWTLVQGAYQKNSHENILKIETNNTMLLTGIIIAHLFIS